MDQARQRVIAAEAGVAMARQRSKAAKKRRAEAKKSARREKKQLRLAKEELGQARKILAPKEKAALGKMGSRGARVKVGAGRPKRGARAKRWKRMKTPRLQALSAVPEATPVPKPIIQPTAQE